MEKYLENVVKAGADWAEAGDGAVLRERTGEGDGRVEFLLSVLRFLSTVVPAQHLTVLRFGNLVLAPKLDLIAFYFV